MAKNKDFDLEFLKLQYQVLANRQVSHNTIVWNTPTLLFVAETLLWGLAFNERVHPILCFLISLFSVFAALASMQQFIRGRVMEIADAEQLYSIETLIKENIQSEKKTMVMVVHQTLDKRTVFINGKERNLEERLRTHCQPYKSNSLGRKKMFNVWKKMFVIMLLLSIVLCLYSIFLMIQETI